MRSIEGLGEHQISSPDKTLRSRMEANPVNLDWLWQIAWRRWPILLALCIFGGLSGVIIALLCPQYWKATALIEIGKYADQPLESTAYTADQLRDPAFSQTLLEQLKQTETEKVARDAKRSMDTLKVRDLRDSKLIEVKVDGPSPQMAKKLATTIFNYLQAHHLKRHDVLVDLLRSRYSEIENAISKIKAEQATLNQLKKTTVVSAEKDGLTDKIMLMMLSAENDTRLRESNKELMDLQEKLLPARTFNTKLVTSIHVSETPTFPSVPLFGTGGAIATLFLGLVWLVMSRSRSETA